VTLRPLHRSSPTVDRLDVMQNTSGSRRFGRTSQRYGLTQKSLSDWKGFFRARKGKHLGLTCAHLGALSSGIKQRFRAYFDNFAETQGARGEATAWKAGIERGLRRVHNFSISHWDGCGTSKQAAKKLGKLGGIEENWPSVAKATCDSVGFMRGLKPPTPSVLSFSAACKVVS
jgi:hypothetical protein